MWRPFLHALTASNISPQSSRAHVQASMGEESMGGFSPNGGLRRMPLCATLHCLPCTACGSSRTSRRPPTCQPLPPAAKAASPCATAQPKQEGDAISCMAGAPGGCSPEELEKVKEYVLRRTQVRLGGWRLGCC